ncbi:MlaD family protein [Pseudoroseicyclus sp. CXY001]|uniref:MlaD family protein n=1 Tax=Pseudoroseicyclus sp. CXY001 TaxID=3242492 RepID=UPI003571799E
MSDESHDPSGEPIRDVPVEKARRSIFERVSIIWVIPVAALLVAGGIAWQSWAQRGPTIDIYFRNAAGITEGETQLRYRDVVVGAVEGVAFSGGMEQVRVTVRLDRDVADYVDEDAQFWVVRPEVTTQGVTGLETVLSGVYLAGQWDNDPGPAARSFEANEEPPLNEGDEQGLTIYLRTSGSSLSGNAPLLYKGVEVGRIGAARVSEDGLTVEAEAFVQAPYDNLVTESTRFWDSSGFSFTLGSAGAALNFDSIASLLAGGVSFDTFVSGGTLAEPGDTFEVFTDRSLARASVFNRRDGVELTLSAVFDQDVTGLASGAPVELDGLRIGEVTGLNGIADGETFGDASVQLQVVFTVQPARLGFDGEGSEAEALEFFARQVGQGLRARLATANLLTGGLKVELVKMDEIEPGLFVERPGEYPVLPTAPSDLIDVSATAEGTLARIDALPIEELLQSAISFLDSAGTLVGSEEIRQVPEELAGVLGDIRGITGSDAVQALPAQIGSVMTDLERSLARIDTLLEVLDEAQAAERVLAAIDNISVVAEGIGGASEGLPELMDSITALAEDARGLGFTELGARAEAVLASAESILASEETQGLPARVGAALDEVTAAAGAARELVAGIDAAGTAERIAAAADSFAAALDAARPSIDAAPALVDELTALAGDARSLGLAELGTRARGVLAEAEALLGSETAQALPAEVSTALGALTSAAADAGAIIRTLQDDQIAARISEAVTAAADAVDSIETGAAELPALVDDARALVARANSLPLETFGAEAERFASAAADLVSSEQAQALPGQLNAALAELAAALEDLRTGGAIANTNATLDAAREAAESIEEAANDLPSLVARANRLADTAAAVLSGYDAESPALREARSALREIARAAQSVSDLARAIERQPNSLILGR